MKQNTKQGLFVISAILILYFGVNYLKNTPIFSNDKTYFAVYDDISELKPSALVVVKGFEVGVVEKIEIVGQGEELRFLVSMAIDDRILIPQGSSAEITGGGFIGAKYIDLKLTGDDLLLEDGDTLTGGYDVPINNLVDKASTAVGNMDSILIAVSNLLSNKNVEHLSSVFENIDVISDRLNTTSTELNSLMRRSSHQLEQTFLYTNQTLNAISARRAQIASAMSRLDSITAMLQNNHLVKLDRMLGAGDTIFGKINEGVGTVGKLVNDSGLYEQLEQTTRNLDLLISDFRANPSKYINVAVFGGRSVNISNIEPYENGQNISFRLLLAVSDTELDTDENRFSRAKPITRQQIKGETHYYSYETQSFYEIYSLHLMLFNEFPQQEILAYQNGKKIPLEKALKKLNTRNP